MEWLEQEKQIFLSVFRRLPVEIDRGEGCYLIDRSGRKYLDFLGGLGVNALGYSHPVVIEAIQRQLRRNMHLSNYFIQDIQIELAQKILQLSGYDRLFFSNSGTESIEGILKLVKKYANFYNKHQIITFQNSFHGRSIGSLSITAQEKYQKEFRPLLPDIVDLPFNDPGVLKETIGPQTAAIFLEFIQGEGGVVPIKEEVVEILAEAQREYDVLIIADEIQTGVGRTGKFLACQHYPIKPDVVAIAKAIGGGLPLGAFLITERLNEILTRGNHGTTFGGNPVACAAGLATLQVMEQEKIFDHVVSLGKFLRESLFSLRQKFPALIKEIRGFGLMQGMEMSVETFPIVLEGLKHGVIFNSTAKKVLRFLPPLIIEKEQVVQGLEVLEKILKQMD